VNAQITPLAGEESTLDRVLALAAVPGEARSVDLALRALDVTIAGTALVVLAVPMGAVGAAVAAVSGRPVLYRGRRVGRAGRPFQTFKFRTLRPGAEDRLAGLIGAELDARAEAEITPLGRVLRRTHVDELPQLICVLRGDMAIVGPRPVRPAFFAQLVEEIPQYWQRLVVPPGMTGLAQIRMTRSIGWEEKLSHDLEWIADRSVSLYLRIILATAVRVLRRSLGVPDREPA
jgi:lipopolysaccharide/colanic/teichoic acid biosynthesis glycosyltransferase